MDFENFMGFLPLLIFVITVVIDKSNRKNRRNRTGAFSRRCRIWTAAGEAAKLMTLQARSKASRKARIKLYIKKKLPHPAGKVKSPGM